MILRPIFCICLLFITPLIQLQAEVGGVLRLKGTVWTNGSPARDGSAIAVGDKVQTGQESFANLSPRPGKSIVVTENSVAFCGDNGVRLESGAAVLVGQNLTAEVAGMTASSEGTNSQFIVHADSTKVEIAAVKGTVTLRDGDKQTKVPEGKVLTKSRGSAAVPASTISNFSGSTALVAILASAASAGIVTGLALYGDDKPTISPYIP